MLERIVVSGLFVAVVSLVAYRWMLDLGWSLFEAQNGLLLLLVLFENVQAGNSRSETASLLTLSPLRNRILLVGTVIAQLVHIGAMYTPGLSQVLRIEPVSLRHWFLTLALALGLFFMAELHKLVIRRRLREGSGMG